MNGTKVMKAFKGCCKNGNELRIAMSEAGGSRTCEYPLSCFNANLLPPDTDIYEVTLSGNGRRLLSLDDIIDDSVKYIQSKVNKEVASCDDDDTVSADVDFGIVTTSGDNSVSSVTGLYSVSKANGDYGISTAIRQFNVSVASEYSGISAVTGGLCASRASGD